ncbi:MAG: transcriptional regulator [Paenibacillus sp.]|jgi:tetratricopeptide (TPR) repeat protein|nr:transcriptional regulator [Paenibacillus sp.]
MSLGRALNIPIETLVDYYVEVENRSDHLMRIYETALTQAGSIEIIRKVAAKYLESQNEDSQELTDKLFESIGHIEDTSIKISLYDLIIDYSRSHGIMPYIAKGLYQKYLIERNNFDRLKETYYSGKYVLNYMNFLIQEQQIELYYKLGVHAYNLRLYRESVDFCKRILAEDNGTSPYRVHALGVLRDSYYRLGKFEESELYFLQFKQFCYPNKHEQSTLMEALFNAKRGHTTLAIEQLQTFLKTCSDAFILSTANDLIRLYLEQNNTEGIKSVLENSRIIPIVDKLNPFDYYKYGEYFRLIGEYFSIIDDFDKSISHLLKGAAYFSKINDSDKEKECLNKIMRIHTENNLTMGDHILKKLSNYFTNAEMEDYT